MPPMIELVQTRGRGRSMVVDAVLIDDQKSEYHFGYVKLMPRVHGTHHTHLPTHHTYPYWRVTLAGKDSVASFGWAAMPTHYGGQGSMPPDTQSLFHHPWDFAERGYDADSMCRLDPAAEMLSCAPETADLSDIGLLEALFQRARKRLAGRR